jgi:hypothetical protein
MASAILSPSKMRKRKTEMTTMMRIMAVNRRAASTSMPLP